MDSLHIKALTVNTHIGVHAWEQQILQPLLIDISITTNFSHCRDNISNTIDYEKLCQEITTYIESRSFQLIETVATQVAELIETTFNVHELKVSVNKPHAIKNASEVRAEVIRSAV